MSAPTAAPVTAPADAQRAAAPIVFLHTETDGVRWAMRMYDTIMSGSPS